MTSAAEKQRRMELRRRVGNRKLPDLPTPRHVGARYLVAHVCFACRHSLKIWPRPERVAVCPRCRGALYEMGRSFKAPAARNREQWAKVQALYAAGFRFFGYRSSCPSLPARLADVENFVRDNPNHPHRVEEPNPLLQPTRAGKAAPAAELKR
jgi:hypothetical protein